MSALHIDVFAAFQDADVHVVVGQHVEALGHQFRVGTLGFCHHLGYLDAVLRHKHEEIVQHHSCVEAQQTGVPEEVAFLHKDVGELGVGLLGEGLDGEDVVTERLVVVHLDVAVARLRSRWRDAHHEKSVVLTDEIESVEHVLPILLLFEDDLVGRCDEQCRLWVLLRNED